MTGAAPEPLLLLGLAGLDWKVLSARLRGSSLPHLAALGQRGLAGPLLSRSVPPGPAGWATLMTGELPHCHGIVTADEPWAGGLRPAGAASWHAPPLWQRLADAGLRTASIGWPASRPGGHWPGLHIDDSFALPTGATWDEWVLLPDAVTPELRDDMAALRVHPHDITGATLTPFVPGLADVDQSRDHRLIELALLLARVQTEHTAAMALIARSGWDFLAVHHHWLGDVLRRFDGAASPFDRVADAAWTLLDALVGRLAAALPGATVLIAGPGSMTGPGTLLAAGPKTERGRSDGANLLDVAPTVLGHFGLTDSGLAGRALLGQGNRPAPPSAPPTVLPQPDAADLARVAAFGHAPPGVSAHWAAQRLTAMAELLLPHDAAAAGLRAAEALALNPDYVPALGVLAASHVAAGESGPLAGIAARIAAAAPGHNWLPLVHAGYHALRGEADAARPHLAAAEAQGTIDALLRAGAAWLMLGRPVEAARVFRQAATVDANSVQAHIGLAMAHEHSPREAEPAWRRALALDPGDRAARAGLAALLTRLGRTHEAAALAPD